MEWNGIRNPEPGFRMIPDSGFPTVKYTNTKLHKYKYTNTNTQIQIHKYKYTNTNTQIQIQIQIQFRSKLTIDPTYAIFLEW